jgi:hypothetical protein
MAYKDSELQGTTPQTIRFIVPPGVVWHLQSLFVQMVPDTQYGDHSVLVTQVRQTTKALYSISPASVQRGTSLFLTLGVGLSDSDTLSPGPIQYSVRAMQDIMMVQNDSITVSGSGAGAADTYLCTLTYEEITL